MQCRQHPGQYEYYKNYDDLEVKFLSDVNFLINFMYFPGLSSINLFLRDSIL